jgi:hypothetical protein
MTTNITRVQDRIHYALSKVAVPSEFPDPEAFVAWNHAGRLERAQTHARARRFYTSVLRQGVGLTNNNSSQTFTDNLFEVVVGYMDFEQIAGESLERGTPGMIMADAALIHQMLFRVKIFGAITVGHPAYDAEVGDLPKISLVGSPRFSERVWDGKCSRFRYWIEVGESA